MKKLTVLGIALLPFLGTMPSSGALSDQFTEQYSRAGQWEVYGTGLYDYLIPAQNGSSVNVYAGGIGVGYNIIDQINVNLEFIAGGASASGGSSFGSTSANLYGGNLGLDYNILKTRLTPFVTAGLGYWRFNYTGGFRGYFPLYAGLGARWDINDKWFAKAEYRVSYMWTLNIVGGNADAVGNGIFLSVGYKF